MGEKLLRNGNSIFTWLGGSCALAKKISKKESGQLRSLIDVCSMLGSYEKSLLIQIDVEGKTVVQVAKELGKAKSAVSSQRTKASQKLTEWQGKSAAKASSDDFDALVFRSFNMRHTPAQVITKLGYVERVKKLAEIWREIEYDDYWKRLIC